MVANLENISQAVIDLLILPVRHLEEVAASQVDKVLKAATVTD